jgi:protein-serine/threonine kinase
MSIGPGVDGRGTITPGPSSPTLHFSEDLSRFPSESLHSFSFAHQSEDLLHNRQNLLRKSIDFMRDRLGWAAGNPGIMTAQAKVTGDLEMQTMMELLAQAKMLRNEEGEDPRFVQGPLTGPANMEGDNIFDKSFATRSESPDELDDQLHIAATNKSQPLRDINSTPRPMSAQRALADVPILKTADFEAAKAKSAEISAVRGGLKRTYTDTAPLNLQTKLMEALAKPYVAKDSNLDTHMLPFNVLPTFGGLTHNGGSRVPAPHHSHSHRWAPAAQAIFTTETEAPWTILAANDLACLVFGVTKSEVRRLGILEVVREDRRAWLEEKLRAPGSAAATKSRTNTTRSRRSSPVREPISKPVKPTSNLVGGGGITAFLLRKPPAREIVKKRSQTDVGIRANTHNTRKGSTHHTGNKSRGVLLCGDVVPIQKRNGATGSASLWVKEKKGGLIWVLEEIVEDTAYLTLDEGNRVLTATGATDHIWGNANTFERLDVLDLMPNLPTMKQASKVNLDYESINKIGHFTARNPEGFNIPISITTRPTLGELRISSFPHIAGIVVLSSKTLQITSSNAVFSAALFGQSSPDGLHISALIPQFDKLLELLTDEEQVSLVDGIVIPEHSFRRARALLALREGHRDAAATLMRPTGLTAKHRDGSQIMVDLQMRVVKSESAAAAPENVIEEEDDDLDGSLDRVHGAEVVYALWITYSRHLHSVPTFGGLLTSTISRPATPPHQPTPGQSVELITPPASDIDEPKMPMTRGSVMARELHEAASEPISSGALHKSIVELKTAQKVKEVPKKKMISDFVILEEMGQGAYGQVKLSRYKLPPSNKVVLKYVTKKRILVDTWTRDRRLGTVPLEIHVLDYLGRDGLKHPNIVEMTDFFEDHINYYIEMVPHGLPGMDLFDYIEMRTTMTEDECRHIFLQVVAAVHHLHTKALVVHRDIKDENVILDGENKVKLIDFGSAAYIKNGPFDVFVGTIGKWLSLLLSQESFH